MMKRLLKKEEREEEINQLKIDLISCFYPFTKEELIHYQSIIKFDYYQRFNSNFINWDLNLIDQLAENIDWKSIYKIKNSRFDYAFFQKYEKRIDFKTIPYSKNIKWSEKLITNFGNQFDWSGSIFNHKALATLENLRRFKTQLNWGYVSEVIQLEFNENIINEFADLWDWKRLSANTNLPASFNFIEQYQQQLDFDKLSQNPQMLNLIYQNPSYKKWKWEKVILNPGIVYKKQTFTLIFNNYKKDFETKEFTHSKQKNMALHTFLFRLFSHQHNDINYLLTADFINYVPWEIFCSYCRTELPLSFIEQHKTKLNFSETAFIKRNKNSFTYEFIEANLELFNATDVSFYRLPITVELLSKTGNEFNWNALSACETIDWNWDFIHLHFDKLNLNKLATNKGIFEKLMLNKLSSTQIYKILNNALLKK